MQRVQWGILALLIVLGGTSSTALAEYGDRSWVRSFAHTYRDPAYYPGRSVYPGSRYGFSGYTRPVSGTDPYPRSMRKVAPPTMYFWSKSMRYGGPVPENHDNIAAPDSAAYDYYQDAE